MLFFVLMNYLWEDKSVFCEFKPVSPGGSFTSLHACSDPRVQVQTVHLQAEITQQEA